MPAADQATEGGFNAAMGRTIQVLRTDRGLDRKELAARSRISYSYLSAIEAGKKQASSEVLLRIAEALGMRSHELFASAEQRVDRATNLSLVPPPRRRWFHGDPEAEDSPAPAQGPGADEARLLDAFRSLALEDRRLLQEIADRMASGI